MLLQSRLPPGPPNALPRSLPFPRILYHQGPFQTQASAEPRLSLSSPQTKSSTSFSTLTAAELVAAAFLPTPADAVPPSSRTFQQHHAPPHSPDPPASKQPAGPAAATHEPRGLHAELHQELRLIEQAIHTMRQPRPPAALPAIPPAARAPWVPHLDALGAAFSDMRPPETAGRWLHLTIPAEPVPPEPAGISFMAGSPSGSRPAPTPSHPQPTPAPSNPPTSPDPPPASPLTKFFARHGAALAAAACLALSLPFLPLHLLPAKAAALATLLTGVVVAGGAVAAAAGCAIGAAAAAAALLILSTEAVVRAAVGSRGRPVRPVAPTPKELLEAVAILCQGRPIGSPRARPPHGPEAQTEERRSWQGAGGLHAGAQHGMAHWEVHGEAHAGPAETAAAAAGAAVPELPGHVLEELARVRRAAAERAAWRHRAEGLPCPPDHAVAAAGAAPGEAGPSGPEPGGPLTGGGGPGSSEAAGGGGGVRSNVLPAGQLPAHSRARQQSQQSQQRP